MSNISELERRKKIERTILSNCLMDAKAIPITVVELSPDNFYFTELKNVYAGIVELFSNENKLDNTLLMHHLTKKGDNQYMQLIMSLMEEYITSAEQTKYIKILQEYKLREITLAHYKESIKKLKKNEDIFELIQETSNFSFNVQFDQKQKNEFNYSNTEKEFEMYIDNLKNTNVVKSGINDLDSILTGFYPTDLILLGARPSVGKTALGLTMFNDIVRKQKKSAVFFSLEMSFFQVYSRLISMNTGIELQKIRTAKLNDYDLKEVERFHKEFANCRFVIDDSAGLKETELSAKLQIYKQKYEIDIAFIDYIGLMRSSVNKQTKSLELGHISNSIKQMAKNLKIPIVCLVQLNRDVEKRAEQRPNLADLRDSGELEQDADTVIFIHRPYSKSDDVNMKGKRETNGELVVSKQRNGSTGICNVHFDETHTQFRGIAHGYETNPNDIPKQSSTKYYNETENDRDFDDTYKDGSQFPF